MRNMQKPTGLGWASVLEVNGVCTIFLHQPGLAVNRLCLHVALTCTPDKGMPCNRWWLALQIPQGVVGGGL